LTLYHGQLLMDKKKNKRKAKVYPSLDQGQKLAASLGYVPLPAVVVKHNLDTIKLLTFKGTLHRTLAFEAIPSTEIEQRD